MNLADVAADLSIAGLPPSTRLRFGWEIAPQGSDVVLRSRRTIARAGRAGGPPACPQPHRRDTDKMASPRPGAGARARPLPSCRHAVAFTNMKSDLIEKRCVFVKHPE